MRVVVERVVASVLLVALAPLFLVVGVVIKLDSPGPVFFWGDRVGLRGRRFRICKFRTMAVGSAGGPAITSARDARVTRVGQGLRRTKLDELPQLVNVVRGEMAFIGPRPEDPQIVERWFTPEQREVLTVRPGMTGPGALLYTVDQQDRLTDAVDADQYYVDHLLAPKLDADLGYVRDRSWMKDLVVLRDTLRYVVGSMVSDR